MKYVHTQDLKSKIKELYIGCLIANTYILAFENVYIHPYYVFDLKNIQDSSIKVFDKYAKGMPLAAPRRVFVHTNDRYGIIPILMCSLGK